MSVLKQTKGLLISAWSAMPDLGPGLDSFSAHFVRHVRKPYALCLWTIVWTLLSFAHVPGAGLLAGLGFLGYLGDRFVFVWTEHLFKQIQDTTEGVRTTALKTIDDVSEKACTALRDVGASAITGGATIQSVLSNAQAHPIGISAALSNLASADSGSQIAGSALTLASLLGLERSLMQTVLGRFANAAAGGLGSLPKTQSLDDIRARFDRMTATSWDRKRLLGLGGMLSSLLGVPVVSDQMKWLKTARDQSKALEDVWDTLEEYLNSIGIVSTGKYAYLAELREAFTKVSKDAEEIAKIIVVEPSKFLIPRYSRQYEEFRASLRTLVDTCARNTCPDLKNSSLFVNISTVSVKAMAWDEIITGVRATSGFRPCPVGVAIQGDSQIGKTWLINEIQSRVTKKLAKLASDDAQKYAAFQDAEKWTRWSVQQRDEYDQGYNGQEITYADDAFSDLENKDHPMYLTFVSSECIGTVQAQLAQKGMPYQSRLVIVTCNRLPHKSITINNVDALHRRFPFLIQARLKSGKSRPAPEDPYDPEFSHLEFHVTSMSGSCAFGNSATGCGWNQGGTPCAAFHKLEDIVTAIAKNVQMAEDKFQTQLQHFQAQSDSSDEDLDALLEECSGELWSDESDSDSEDLPPPPPELLDWEVEPGCSRLPAIDEESESGEADSESESDPKPPSQALVPVHLDYTVEEPGSEPEAESETDSECDEIIAEPEEDDPDAMEFAPPQLSPPQIHAPTTITVTRECPGGEKEEEAIPFSKEILKAVCDAFKVSPIETIDDIRVVRWLSCLVTPEGDDAIKWCADREVISAMDVLRNVHRFKIDRKREEEFAVAWATTFSNPVRINDEAKESSVVLWLKLEFARSPFPVPYMPGVLEDFKHVTNLTSRADEVSCFIRDLAVSTDGMDGLVFRAKFGRKAFKGTPFELWRLRSPHMIWGHLAGPQFCNFAGLMSGATALLATCFYPAPVLGIVRGVDAIAAAAVLRDSYLVSRYARMDFDRIPVVAFLHRIVDQVKAKNLPIVAYLQKPLEYVNKYVYSFTKIVKDITDLFDLTRDFVSFCIIKGAEFLGIPISEVLKFLADTIGTGVSVAVAGLFVGLIVAVITSILRLIFPGPSRTKRTSRNQAQSVTHSGRRRAARVTTRVSKVKSAQSLTHRPSRRVGVQKKLKTQGFSPSSTPSPYNKYDDPSLACPFCDEDLIEADGETFVANDFIAKPAKYARADEHYVLFKEGVCDSENLWQQRPKLMAEIEAVHKFAADSSAEIYAVEKNMGPYSGGSIPHNHIHFLVNSDWESFPSTVNASLEVAEAGVYKEKDSSYSIEIGFRVMQGSELEIFKTFDPLMEVLGFPSWSFNALYSQGVGYGIVSISTTINAGVEGILDRKTIKKVKDVLNQIRNVSVPVYWYEWENSDYQATSAPDFAEVQGLADASVSLARGYTSHAQVWVACPRNPEQGLAEYANFDTAVASRIAGIRFENFVLVPAHIGKVGYLLKVGDLGVNPLTSVDHKVAPYHVYEIIASSEIHHTALAKFVSPKDLQDRILKGTGLDRVKSFKNQKPDGSVDYGKWIWTHVIRDEDLSSRVEGRQIVQWLPTKGTFCAARVAFAGTKNIEYTHRNNYVKEPIRVLDITGLVSDASLTTAGDCGGMVWLLDDSLTRRLAGFHIIGGAYSCYSAILTEGSLRALIDQGSATPQGLENDLQLSRFTVDTNLIEFVPGGKAGLGADFSSLWPEVTWASNDPNSHWIDRSGKILAADVPQGPRARAIGVVTAEHRATGSDTNMFKRGWRESPFFGVFPVNYEPSVMSATDPRLEADLPLNLAREPTCLHANIAAARAKPSPDPAVLQTVTTAWIEYFSSALAGFKVGLHTRDPEVVLDIGINGLPAGHFHTGLQLNASAGFPWNTFPAATKKSSYIGIQPDGRRVFKDTTEARRCRGITLNKIKCAFKCTRTTSFFATKLKDCLVKLKHVKSGKVRCFNAASIESVIATRGFYGPWLEVFYDKRDLFRHAGCIDVNSMEWHLMWQNLRELPNVFDVDFKEFDKSLGPELMMCAKMIPIEIIRRVDDDGLANARYTLAEEDIFSIMLDNRSVWLSKGSNKSGVTTTMMDNHFVNLVALGYAWHKHFGYFSVAHLLEHTRLRFLGDDEIQSVSADAALQGWNRLTYFALLESLGLQPTIATKVEGQEVTPFVDWADAQFLKATTTWLTDNGVRPIGEGFATYALEKESIEAVFGWSQVPSSSISTWTEIVSSHLDMAYGHGPEYYEKFRSALQERVASRNFPLSLREALAAPLSDAWGTRHLKRVKLPSVEAEDPGRDFNKYVATHGGTLYRALAATDIGSLGTELAALKQEINSLGLTVQAIDRRVANNESRINQLFVDFPEVQNKVQNLSDHVSALSETVDGINSRISDLVAKLTDIVNRFNFDFDYLQGRVDDLKSDLSGQIASLSSTVEGFDSRIGDVEKQMSSLDTLVGQIKDAFDIRVTLLEDKVGSLTAQSQLHSADIAILRGDFEKLNTSVRNCVRFNVEYDVKCWAYFNDVLGTFEAREFTVDKPSLQVAAPTSQRSQQNQNDGTIQSSKGPGNSDAVSRISFPSVGQ
jgi:diadenosine tetraphosphate (Ap4A) HIT family hydrolase